jgi:hypothetical protein
VGWRGVGWWWGQRGHPGEPVGRVPVQEGGRDAHGRRRGWLRSECGAQEGLGPRRAAQCRRAGWAGCLAGRRPARGGRELAAIFKHNTKGFAYIFTN